MANKKKVRQVYDMLNKMAATGKKPLREYEDAVMAFTGMSREEASILLFKRESPKKEMTDADIERVVESMGFILKA